VNWAKRVLVLLVLANWFACVVHCQSEQAQLIGNSTKDLQPSFQAASQDGSAEDSHICDWVVTGGNKASENLIAAPEIISELIFIFAPALHQDAKLPPKQAHFAEWSTPPPDSPGTFLFVCRTALPVRAPSLPS
jgi:hypothetical protein